ncbi:MAG: hypothetical protein EOO20_06310 [Chryseobacterium sp.]|nr:MAG: hypothetical protein EOO20_06310 [Chryseobacterium sp.]
MTAIENYYDLLHKITISDFNISLHIHPEDKDDLNKEQENNSKLKQEIESLKMMLSQKNEEADTIRAAFIHVASGVLDSFKRIKSYGNYYPDLGQGMVIPGYLFGKILDDFNIVLKYEGGLPGTEIYMSQQAWPYEQLQELIQHIRDDLFKTNFASKMDAIEYYEYIKKSFLEIVDTLRQKQII